MMLPEFIENEAALDELMTHPRPALVQCIRSVQSPLVILGAGGKMGPTLAALAKRAADAAGHPLEVIAVSRFSNAATRTWLETRRVETLSCDLMEWDIHLPDSANVIYLVGLKFGTSSSPASTWAANTLVPANVARRYPHARIVALSTGNVYPLVAVDSSGSRETDRLTPLGEYANSCVGRERIFEYLSRMNGTPIALIRLNYALDLRYGVLVDIARKVYSGEPVDVTMGYLNCIWQSDANEMILRALALPSPPPTPINSTGTEKLSVRALALRFGELLGREVRITGAEAATALLSNVDNMRAHLGAPPTPVDAVMRWTARWIMQGGPLLDKPTHFETRDGGY